MNLDAELRPGLVEAKLELPRREVAGRLRIEWLDLDVARGIGQNPRIIEIETQLTIGIAEVTNVGEFASGHDVVIGLGER